MRMCQGIAQFLVALCLGVASTHAQENCLHPETQWSCIGVIEITEINDDIPGKSERLRMTQFSNGEILAEIERGGVLSRALILKSGITLYQGVDEKGISQPAQNPFMFFNDSIGWGAVLPLHKAYPAGSASLPDGSVQMTIEIEVDRLDIEITKLADGDIRFHYQVPGRGSVVNGSWKAHPPAPWADEEPVSSWRHAGSEVFQKLEEVRASGK